MVTAALLVGSAPVATVHPAGQVDLAARTIRVADIALLSGADPAARSTLGRHIVAALPAGRNSMSLTRTQLAGLLRRSLPSLVVRGGSDEVVRLSFAASASAAGRCFELSQAVVRGAALTLEDVASTPCDPHRAAAAIRFDREGAAVRAGGDLAEGSYLGRVELPAEHGVEAGDRLTLTSVVGPVRIDRDVVALQSGRRGRGLFVRDSDGQAIAAPLADARQKGDK
jgi:hypothetical protein